MGIINRVRPARDRLDEEARRLFDNADRLSRGNLSLLAATLKRMSETESRDAAAAIAYYAIFSLFPMLILLVILATLFLEMGSSYNQLISFVAGILPPAEEIVSEDIQRILLIGNELDIQLPLREILLENFRQIIHLRLPVGIAATAGFIWSSTAVFVILSKNIDRAWSSSEGRKPLEWRLVGAAMAGSMLIGLLLFSMVVVSIVGLLNYVMIILQGSANAPLSQAGLSFFYRLLPDLMIFITFTIIYCWAPNIHVDWPDAAKGALAATICWDISKMVFSWYLESGISNHMLIYGSLGTVIILMLWIYLSGLICLFGAHLAAQIVRKRQIES